MSCRVYRLDEQLNAKKKKSQLPYKNDFIAALCCLCVCAVYSGGEISNIIIRSIHIQYNHTFDTLRFSTHFFFPLKWSANKFCCFWLAQRVLTFCFNVFVFSYILLLPFHFFFARIWIYFLKIWISSMDWNDEHKTISVKTNNLAISVDLLSLFWCKKKIFSGSKANKEWQNQ